MVPDLRGYHPIDPVSLMIDHPGADRKTIARLKEEHDLESLMQAIARRDREDAERAAQRLDISN